MLREHVMLERMVMLLFYSIKNVTTFEETTMRFKSAFITDGKSTFIDDIGEKYCNLTELEQDNASNVTML